MMYEFTQVTGLHHKTAIRLLMPLASPYPTCMRWVNWVLSLVIFMSCQPTSVSAFIRGELLEKRRLKRFPEGN